MPRQKTVKSRKSAKKSNAKTSFISKILSSKKRTLLVVIPTFAIIGALVYQFSFAGAKYTFYYNSRDVTHPNGGVAVNLGKGRMVWRTNPVYNMPHADGNFWQTNAWAPAGSTVCIKITNVGGLAQGILWTGGNAPTFEISNGKWTRICARSKQSWSGHSVRMATGTIYIEQMSVTLP